MISARVVVAKNTRTVVEKTKKVVILCRNSTKAE